MSAVETARRHLDGVEERARVATDRAQPWADRIARVGYLAKGIVYMVVGALALQAAAGLGGKVTDSSGALLAVARAPAGRLALAAIALGLLAHALFRALLAFIGERDDERERRHPVIRRIGHGFSAFVYGSLAMTAGGWALRLRSVRVPNHDREAQQLSARVLDVPFGRALLIAIGLAVLVGAAFWLVRAFGRNDVRQRLRVERMSERTCRAMALLGRVAYFARAAILAVIGYGVLNAGLHAAPRAAQGPAGALRSFGQHEHGALVLGAIAAGLVAFGLYLILEARWRRLFGR